MQYPKREEEARRILFHTADNIIKWGAVESGRSNISYLCKEAGIPGPDEYASLGDWAEGTSVHLARMVPPTRGADRLP